MTAPAAATPQPSSAGPPAARPSATPAAATSASAAPAGAGPRPGTRGTRTVLATGTAAAVACFAIALVLETVGRPRGGGSATDPGVVLRSAVALEPWGWATLGTFAVIASPVLAIVATAVEYARAGDRRTALTAVAVLVVLGLSLGVALAAR